MPGVSPEEMASMQEKAGANQGGDITALAQQVGDGLSQLGEALSGSPGVTEQDRAQMAQILELYIDLVEKKLGGSAPGQDAPPEDEMAQAAVDGMGGGKGVPMGPGM
jgi:hypothetical protein